MAVETYPNITLFSLLQPPRRVEASSGFPLAAPAQRRGCDGAQVIGSAVHRYQSSPRRISKTAVLSITPCNVSVPGPLPNATTSSTVTSADFV